MKIPTTNIIIHTQYATVVSRKGICGGTAVVNPLNWLRINSFGRNRTSSGGSWFGWHRATKRLNVWPFSIWF